MSACYIFYTVIRSRNSNLIVTTPHQQQLCKLRDADFAIPFTMSMSYKYIHSFIMLYVLCKWNIKEDLSLEI